VRAAVDLIPRADAHGPIVVGFDVAGEGKDLSVVIARQGPIVHEPTQWGQVNTTAAIEARFKSVSTTGKKLESVGKVLLGWDHVRRRFRLSLIQGLEPTFERVLMDQSFSGCEVYRSPSTALYFLPRMKSGKNWRNVRRMRRSPSCE
jgi:hypothetical protein